MKKTQIAIIILFLLIGYGLGSFFPALEVIDFFGLSKSSEDKSEPESIKGMVELEITIKLSGTEEPVPNLEVDLAAEPGPPPVGGIAYTNEQGVALFNVKPGNYFIYFNSNSFPDDLEIPGSEEITVIEGVVNEKIVFLDSKGN